MDINLEINKKQRDLFTVENTSHEFEIRLRTNQYGVSLQLYESIKQFFDNESKKQNSFYSVFTEQYENVLYEKKGDSTVYRLRKDKEYISTKQSILSEDEDKNKDITYLGFSLRISKAIETEQKGKSLPAGYLARFCRYINRTSFIYKKDDKNKWKIDCSEVTNKRITENDTCGKSSSTTYEIEVEFFPEQANVVFFSELYPVIQQLVIIMYKNTPVPKQILCLQKNSVDLIQRTLLDEIQVNDERFEPHQLFATLRGLAVNIKEQDIETLDRKQYALTNKLDGERKFIFVYNNTIYCLNSGGAFLNGTQLDSFYVLPSKTGVTIPNCLIDCELDHGTFWMFDTLYQEGNFLPRTEKHHRDRMACIDPSWFSFPFQKKHFYYGTQEENIRSLVTTFPDASQFFKENDGFIFTYTQGSYLDTNKKNNHLKYKFSSKLSLDFLLVEPSLEYKKQLENENNNHIPYFYILLSNEKTQRGILKSMTPLRSNSIVECLWYNNTWIMLRYRDDRFSGNKDSVISDVFKDMETPLSLEKMFPFPSEQITSYITTLSLLNKSYVIDHFYDSLLSLFYIINPVLVLQTIQNILSIDDMNFYRIIKSNWFQLIPMTDINVLSSIFSIITNEYTYLYNMPELHSIKENYKKLFVHDTDKSIYDVRTNSFFNESNMICRSNHHWITSILPKTLVPRITHSPKEYDHFDQSIIDEDNTYEHMLVVHKSNYPTLVPFEKKQVSKVYKKWFRSLKHITRIVDATAKCGVDTIHLATHFSNAMIDSYETNDENVWALEYNTKIVGLQDRVHIHYEDITTWLPTSPIDILYIDPPYHSQKKCMNLYLQSERELPMIEKNINYLIDQWMKTTFVKHIIVKIPLHFNKSYLFAKYKIEEVAIYNIDRTFSYYLLHIQPTIDILYKSKSNLTLWTIPYCCSNNYDMLFYNTNSVLVQVPFSPQCMINTITVVNNIATIMYTTEYIVLPIGLQITLSGISNPYFNQTYTVIESTSTYVRAKPYKNLFNKTIRGGIMLINNPELISYFTCIDWIYTRFYYYMFQPFSYEKPQLLDLEKLEQKALEHHFIKKSDIRIKDRLYVLYTKLDSKHNQDETSMLENMRKYHNIEKKYLIKNYARTKSVLDLGAGFGGDLFKYEEVNVPRLILVEPSTENLLTLKSRLDKTSTIQYNTTLIHAMGQDWEKIKPYVSERVDVVSSFFSLTFLFESITILRSFLHTVKESIIEGGYFIGTMMSGEKTYQKLIDLPYNNTIKIGTDITMKKQYENGDAQPGMKLHISITDTIVTEQTEYLAFYSILKQELETLGFEEILVYDFTPPTKLTPFEIEFSKLNIGFVFRYAPSVVSYPTPFLVEDESYEFLNLYGESQVLIRTGVQRAFSFYHSFLYNTSHAYRSSREQRQSLAEKEYMEFKQYMNTDLPTDMSIPLLEHFMKWKDCNIYLIDIHTRYPMKYTGIDNKREYSIIMSYTESNEYEPVAIIQHEEALRIFPKINSFIARIHRKRK